MRFLIRRQLTYQRTERVLFVMRFHIVLLAALIAMMAPDSLRVQQRILRSGNPDGQLTASDVIADTGAPYNNVFRNQSIGGPRIRPRVGGGNAYINGLPEFRMEPLLRTPFIRRGFNPDDSLIKLGILYIDIDTARLSIFHTDIVLQGLDIIVIPEKFFSF